MSNLRDLIKNPTELNWLKTKNRHQKNSAKGCQVTVYNKKNKQLCITLFDDVMKKCRLYAGDKVNLAYDENFIYIKRDTHGGFTLSPRSATKGEADKLRGQHCHCNIKKTMGKDIDKFKHKNIDIHELIIDDDRYTLIIPIA